MTDIIHNPSEDTTVQHDEQCDTKKAHIGHNLAAIRRSRGMSQEYVALKLGKSQQTVSNIESVKDVPEELLAQIANILGVTPDYVKNYDLERVMTNNNTQIIYDGGRGNFLTDNSSERTQITNSLDVIKYIVAENKHLNEKSLHEKDLMIKELKTEIKLLNTEIKRLNGELQQAKSSSKK